MFKLEYGYGNVQFSNNLSLDSNIEWVMLNNTYLNIVKIFNKFKKNEHHRNVKFGSYIDLDKGSF